MTGMPRARKRNAIDQYVGARLRDRRKALGMNQAVLGKSLGLTFQMIQRYEYGACRISASTLYAMALALEVPVAYFFDGLPTAPGGSVERTSPETPLGMMTQTRDGRALAHLFPQITHRGSRRAVVELVRAMVGEA